MKISLARPVDLVAYQAVMEIGRAEKRRDILSVLMLAKEHGGRITAEDICEHLLIDRPIALGRTVIARCQELGLFDGDGRLTSLGEDALQHGRIFHPERGRYRLLCTLDPLIQQHLLGVEEVCEPEAHEVIRLRKQTRESKRPGSPGWDIVPPWLKGLEGVTLTLVDSGEEIRILTVEPKGVKDMQRPDENFTLHWTLPPDREPTLELRGLAHRILEPPEVSHEVVFLELLGQRRDDWAPEVGALRVGFEETSEVERSSFRRTLTVSQPSLERFGTFGPTDIRDIPLAPGTPSDAQHWAEWILDRAITGYLDHGAYEDLLRRVANLFPGFSPTLPSQGRKAEALRGGVDSKRDRLPRAYWFLQAPLDLDMPEASE